MDNKEIKDIYEEIFLTYAAGAPTPRLWLDLECQKNIGVDLQGWFDFQIIYNTIARDPAVTKMAELGVWKGTSISYLAYYCKKFKPYFELYAVDSFIGEGADTEESYAESKCKDIYDIYNNNLKILDLRNNIIDIKSNSCEAADKFADN